MLNDRQRTERFLAAIRAVVRPGDVVLDIGTGTGVLALTAARAGARHVYAVEANRMGRAARNSFTHNGLADRITLVQGWSTQVTLPERADVLVSEILGNEPLSESILQATTDARTRLLKPDARLIPGRVKVFGLPVTIPAAELGNRAPTPEALRNWQAWYGLDFSPFAEAAGNAPYMYMVKPTTARQWKALTAPVLLTDIDLKTIRDAAVEATVAVAASGEGPLDGVLVYFDSELAPGISLSTAPMEANEACSWRIPVWIFVEPLTVKPGDRLHLTYNYHSPGSPNGVRVALA
jgi:protein arginine N-methyltransferase 1